MNNTLVDQVPPPAGRLQACKWSEKEDAKLREVCSPSQSCALAQLTPASLQIIAMQGARNWKDVSSHIPGRTHVQCLQRWNKVLKPGLKKGTWQPEEDDLLARQVGEFLDTGADSPNWTSIAKHIEGRTAKQCRERWRCNLDPQIKKTEWSPEEDVMILNMQQALGNRWALLAKQLPGRTENAIKTRFRSLQRSLKRKWNQTEDDKIRACVAQGMNFADIAAEMPRRSVNSVKVRYKMLTEEEGSQQHAAAAAHTPPPSSSEVVGYALPTMAPPPPPIPMLLHQQQQQLSMTLDPAPPQQPTFHDHSSHML
ncbi:hypothetical protein BASA81_008261 [Batrachochytrium salamandrivorans]|nr:hypothetical protein BASA81_008261 [Batrachochytrium salamandrivorans]